jgi:transposase
LRKVDRILESSFIRKLTAACYASGVGRPSIDPEVFFRMLLVAYLYDIKSDRQLCEDVHRTFAYRWFCRLALLDRVPDHSSFSRIRDRMARTSSRHSSEGSWSSAKSGAWSAPSVE